MKIRVFRDFRVSILLMACLMAALLGCATHDTGSSPSTMTMSSPGSRAALQNAMRDLWADHVIWTRLYIIAAVDGGPDAKAAATRLLANQDQIGQAIVPYYGAAAGNQLAALLRDHILIAVDLVDAAKANDRTKLQDADRRWHSNASDIATFLSGANPRWERGALLSMLNEHLALTTKEATARLQRNWNEDIATFDQIFDQAMMMADELSAGIINQFPDRFRT